MQTQQKTQSAAKHNNSFTNCSSKDNGQILSKLTVSLENQQYTLPISKNSTIEKLALQLMIMIYEELLEQDLSQDSKEVHSKICQLLLDSLDSLIQQETNYKVKQLLTQIVISYQHQQSNLSPLKEIQNNKYFSKNYIHTLSDTASITQSSNTFSSHTASSTNIKLYDKAQKSIEKRRNLQKQNAQQKSKVEISYCTFHPNISKSQKKFKSKEQSNVFNRLYTQADELKLKNFFKRKQIECEEQKVNSSFKYIPEINECSKKIIKFKQGQHAEDSFLYEHLEKSQVSFQASQNSSKKYLKQQSSRKVFEKLYDSSFYENRMNKTLQKFNQSKEKNKENDCSFHPELSAGTKRMTKNLPKLQNRMKIYELRKTENNMRPSPDLSKKKQKSISKNPSKANFFMPAKNQIFQQKEKKGIKKMLDRIKTQAYQQLQSSYSTIQSKGPAIDKFNSQIFRVDTEFIGDEGSFEITPKKLNLQPQRQKNFFNNWQSKPTASQGNLQKSRQIKMQKHTSNLKQLQNKEQIFSKIFFSLSRNSNEITAKQIISNRQIPLQIKEILTPLTEQLLEMNTQLDKEEFTWSLQNLYEQLEWENKGVLLSWGLKLFKTSVPSQKSYGNLKHIKTEGSVFELME